jgi:hypothetical protein
MQRIVKATSIAEIFTELDSLFGEYGITKNWFHALKNGESFLYYENFKVIGIVNIQNISGTILVNSGHKGDKFPLSMVKTIRQHCINSDKAIIQSLNITISSAMLKRYGFSYNSERQYYSKGV